MKRKSEIIEELKKEINSRRAYHSNVLSKPYDRIDKMFDESIVSKINALCWVLGDEFRYNAIFHELITPEPQIITCADELE